MRHRPTILAIAVLLGALGAPIVPWTAAGAQATPPATRPDTVAAVFRRAQRLVNDGMGTEGRALIDSVLNATEPRSLEEAEALYWRATLAASWDDAQRDYLRIMLEHERSPRYGDAMLRLAQGEVARGDRAAAENYLQRLAREAPTSPARAEGGLWHGRLLVERGARDEGCAVLRGARTLVAPGALELENQYDYLLRDCPAAIARGDSGRADTARAATPPQGLPPATRPPADPPSPRAGERAPAADAWSVQVAAFSTEAEARALVAKLRERGYDARVDGTAAPFRVRFGRFATRAQAATAMAAYRTAERADAFLVQAPRGAP